MYKDTDITFLATLQETLSVNPDASQRDIAQKQEISLGMTNAVLSRLAQKGWILMQRLDGRKIRYALTPEGIAKLAERSSAYMKRTFADMRLYGSSIARRIQKAKADGLTRVVLYGRSNLDFLIEYSARMFGMSYSTAPVSALEHGVPDGTYGIVGELSVSEVPPADVKPGQLLADNATGYGAAQAELPVTEGTSAYGAFPPQTGADSATATYGTLVTAYELAG